MRSPRLITDDFYRGQPLFHPPGARTVYRQDILDRIYEILSEACERHNKVLFVRFDLAFPSNYPPPADNRPFSAFINRLDRSLKEKRLDPRFFYCRETGETCGGVHYHAAILLDGNKIQRIEGILKEAEHLWGVTLGTDPRGLVNFCNKPADGEMFNGISLRRNDPAFGTLFAYCFRWSAYLAKNRQKNNTPHNVRSFGSSRLR